MPLLLSFPTRYSTCSLKFQNDRSETRLFAPATLAMAPSFIFQPSARLGIRPCHPERSLWLNNSTAVPSRHEPSSFSVMTGARTPTHFKTSPSEERRTPSNLPSALQRAV